VLQASSLNLAVTAIILWNTVYLARAVDALRARGETLPVSNALTLSFLGTLVDGEKGSS
jgi:hypothetical protein